MQLDCITVSLGLPEFRVLWVHESDSLVWMKVVERNEFALCPECGRVTQHFHDERVDDVWGVSILEISDCTVGRIQQVLAQREVN